MELGIEEGNDYMYICVCVCVCISVLVNCQFIKKKKERIFHLLLQLSPDLSLFVMVVCRSTNQSSSLSSVARHCQSSFALGQSRSSARSLIPPPISKLHVVLSHILYAVVDLQPVIAAAQQLLCACWNLAFGYGFFVILVSVYGFSW